MKIGEAKQKPPVTATKAVGTDTLAYLQDEDNKKKGQTHTGFVANSGTVPMIAGNFAPSPGSQIAMG